MTGTGAALERKKSREAEQRFIQKRKLVLFAGGKCSVCGYAKNLAALNFHHLDKHTKEIHLNKYLRPWDVLVKELAKCALLCANCHHEHHDKADKLEHSQVRHTINIRNHRVRRKRAMIAYKGGKCQLCAYDKCHASLVFHHRDPSTKNFPVSRAGYAWKRILPELDKCDLLCFNCHMELHHPKLSVS